jgi:hypothetical protein
MNYRAAFSFNVCRWLGDLVLGSGECACISLGVMSGDVDVHMLGSVSSPTVGVLRHPLRRRSKLGGITGNKDFEW